MSSCRIGSPTTPSTRFGQRADEDGTSWPGGRVHVPAAPGPVAELSISRCSAAETVYSSGAVRRRRGRGRGVRSRVPGSRHRRLRVRLPANLVHREPAVWTTVPATEHAVIPFVPDRRGRTGLKVAEVDQTGLIGMATNQQVFVARRAPPRRSARRHRPQAHGHVSRTTTWSLPPHPHDDLAVATAAGSGNAVRRRHRARPDHVRRRVKDVVLRREPDRPGLSRSPCRVRAVHRRPTVTTTLRVCVASCPFTGGSATVQSTSRRLTDSHPSYNSSYQAWPRASARHRRPTRTSGSATVQPSRTRRASCT